MNIDGDSYIYYGTLDAFYFNDEGQLDRLILIGVARRKLNADYQTQGSEIVLDNNTQEQSEKESLPGPRFYDIEGDRFIIKYEEIKNINIEYYYVEEFDEVQQQSL